MSETVIRVENISKRYRIGLKEQQADTFAQQMVDLIKYPISNFRRIKSLSKFNNDEEGVHWALKDIDFEVKQGEVLGIIGKNGAGKSTLLKILSKITEPTYGRIEMKGRVAALLEVGTGFHPELTGRENIYMNGTMLGMTKKEIDRKLDEIIDFSGVDKYIDTPVKFYSSGMRVRLGFSVAAYLEPEILIIDEVLAVGDHEFQQKCLGKMEDVSKNQGRTVLFVSHNLEMVNQLCDNSLVLENGKLIFLGSTKESISKYLSSKKIKNIDLELEKISGIGNKTMQLTEVIIYGEKENYLAEVSTLNELNLKLSFIVNDIKKMYKPRIDIRIDNRFNQRLLWLSTIDKSVNWGKNKILFHIPKTQLRPGLYNLTIFMHDGLEVSDWHKDLLSFEVHASNSSIDIKHIPQNQSDFICIYDVY